MKQCMWLFVVIFFVISSSYLAAQGLTVSGLLDSSVSMRAGAGDAPAASYGAEEYANLRMQARLRDKAVFYGAVNFIAASGDSAAAGVSTGLLAAGENYAAAIELERLYFRLNGEAVDFDGGLLRLPFGYGQIWGPSDFLNPRNPLIPDARPRAILGAGLFWYPNDDLKLLAFGAAPKGRAGNHADFSQDGGGTLTGLSMDRHWEKASLQLLYSFETPQSGSNRGIHRAGISVKADLELGLMMDALYTYNNEAETKPDGIQMPGLSLSIGADYSFFGGNLIVLAEYLYNGAASSTSVSGGGDFFNEHYLYTGFTWRFSDYTNMTIALISGFDDISFTPIVTLNHDLFQGATLIISAQVPLDRDLLSGDGNRGELGPLPPEYSSGRYFDCSMKLRLRF